MSTNIVIRLSHALDSFSRASSDSSSHSALVAAMVIASTVIPKIKSWGRLGGLRLSAVAIKLTSNAMDPKIRLPNIHLKKTRTHPRKLLGNCFGN